MTTATAAHTADGEVKITESLSGYYISTTYGGTTYRVYHHTAKPQVGAVVTRNKAGQCQRFQTQRHYSGAWHTLTTSPCYILNSSSLAAARLGLTNAVGQVPRPLRVRPQQRRQHQPQYLEWLAVLHRQDLTRFGPRRSPAGRASPPRAEHDVPLVEALRAAGCADRAGLCWARRSLTRASYGHW